MTDFSAAAAETFQILQSYDYTVSLYDDANNSVMEPEDARRFYAIADNVQVRISEDGENSDVTLFLGARVDTESVTGLIETLRTSANKFNLLFHVRRLGKDLKPKDFANSTMIEAQEYPAMNITEGMYGTSRSSYLKLDNARMIVRHSGKIDDKALGARGRAIESIFIENKAGERTLFPTKNLAPARAMCHHVSQGGAMNDALGEHITEMAHDYARLGQVSRHVQANRHNLDEAAVPVREACRCKMGKLRRTFERFCRPGGYATESQRFADGQMLNEATPMVETTAIEEMRRLLCGEGRELDESTIESACRASNEAEDTATTMMNDPTPQAQVAAPGTADITEGAKKLPPRPTVVVFGKTVDREAWEKLSNQQSIDLMRDPMKPVYATKAKAARAENLGTPTYPSLASEIEAKLNLLVPCIKDDTLMAMLSEVTMKLPFEKDREVKTKMLRVAAAALRAAGMELTMIPTKNPVVREFADWMSRFRTESIINEDSMTPRHQMGDNPFERDTTDLDDAVAAAVSDFDVEDFVSAYESDESDSISRDSLIDAIESHLMAAVERTTEENPSDIKSDAERLLPKVQAALQAKGIAVTGTGQDSHGADLAEALELSREDILLPKPGQGQDLRQEVIKRHDTTGQPTPQASADETDEQAVETGDQNGELDRLRKLSGM